LDQGDEDDDVEDDPAFVDAKERKSLFRYSSSSSQICHALSLLQLQCDTNLIANLSSNWFQSMIGLETRMWVAFTRINQNVLIIVWQCASKEYCCPMQLTDICDSKTKIVVPMA